MSTGEPARSRLVCRKTYFKPWTATKEETVLKNRHHGVGLTILVMLVLAGVLGCQAGPRPKASLLDECGHRAAATRDWCLSIQFPSIL